MPQWGVFSVIVLLLVSRRATAGLVPNPEPVGNWAGNQIVLLNEVIKKDSRQALSISYQLYTKRSDLSEANRSWATVLYASLLMDNDSIGKAWNLLIDTTGPDLNNLTMQMKAFHRLTLGTGYSFLGTYAKAELLFRQAERYSRDPIITVKIHQALANNLRYEGKLDQSFSKWLTALSQSEELNDSSEIAECRLGIGIVEYLKGDLAKAERNVSLYHDYSRVTGNQKNLATALSMFGLIAYEKDQLEKSVEWSLRAYRIRLEIEDLKGQGESLNNLALAYMSLKNWAQALDYLENAVLVKAQANDLSQMTVIHNNIGHCHKQMGNTDKALEYFIRALEIGKKNGQWGDVLRSYRNLITVHSNIVNDFEKAFELQSMAIQLKDSLADVERQEAMNELEVRYETNQKQQEIELLQKEQSIITNRWLTLALGLFFVIILGVLVYDNQRRKHRQEKNLLSAEDELRKAELKIMSDLLEHNQQKLALYMENLLSKNELVNKLEEKLKNAVEEGDLDERKAIIENVSSVRILTDDDWEEFKQLFDGVHRGLLERLVVMHNKLTLGEQRLFLLMKLSMSTKQIANMLGVSPDSVKKGRYRLKKKLRLGDSVSLQNYIDDF